MVVYELENINTVDDLKKAMSSHASAANYLYKKAIELNCQNEQFFINWQDELNVASITQEGDY